MIEIDFKKMDGLAPAIIQDASSGEILMLGFVSPEAWATTLKTGYVTFYSRTRKELWTKGETSGNRLRVVSASTDCDRDTLLIQVDVEGAGAVCHEGTRSCFTKVIPSPAVVGAGDLSEQRGSRAGAPAPHLQESER